MTEDQARSTDILTRTTGSGAPSRLHAKSRVAFARADGKYVLDEDFTVYLEPDKIAKLLESVSLDTKKPPPESQFDWTGEVLVDGCAGPTSPGRLTIARSHAGQLWSVTARVKRNKGADYQKGNPYRGSPALKCGYEPGRSYPQIAGQTLFNVDDVCRPIVTELDLSGQHERAGLVLVTGETGSLKSQVARGLVFSYLEGRVSQRASLKRTPHLVTYEDPIEDWYWKSRTPDISHREASVKVAQTRGGQFLNYTPRQKRSPPLDGDVGSLAEALSAAKRQTPTVFYVGEVRTPEDLHEVLDFAGTGHLIVTTPHASSVSEAMGRLLLAYRPQGQFTAADRAVVADRVLAIVHNRLWADADLQCSGVIPSLWRQHGIGRQAFISDGLSAVSAVNPLDSETDASSLGRFWFAKKLLDTSVHDTNESPQIVRSVKRGRKTARSALLRWAIESDLTGRK